MGSLARIPVGHVDINGLAVMLGLSPSTIPALERRGDPMIPPCSPLAGFGERRRAIWRVVDVERHIEALAAARPERAAPATAATPAPTPAVPAPSLNAVWGIAASQPATAAAPAARRKPGRPRGTGKHSK